ncbi:hypothetical protein HZR02_08895 [Elizabethkingia anophelis]|nr:hypothetical protein [Elizabethkingia anophelis]MCT3659008.1 hypothetical protein [Elizabethkingia anophelis]MCT3666173.1 hypothetical protein [Elizabethkingia anophelis]MCT3852196.1 hypothetical protein [Elizabethkingia anophelis]MCT3863013.1 hypothetical protein [Elizabethkingia anophelis]
MNYKIKTCTQRAFALFMLFSIGFIGSIQAQTLESVFIKNVPVIDSAKSVKQLSEASAQLDIAAAKWNKEWIANYYAAYAKIIISFQEQDGQKKDVLLSQAETYLGKIHSLSMENDETDVLNALLINAKIAVDPQARASQNAAAFSAYLNKAKGKNSNNPRIYYVKGLSLFYTPKAFGGGKEAAKSFFEKASLLFEKENTTSFLNPHWGRAINDYYLFQCK